MYYHIPYRNNNAPSNHRWPSKQNVDNCLYSIVSGLSVLIQMFQDGESCNQRMRIGSGHLLHDRFTQ